MHIVIIGNGIGGITTARWIRKLSDHKITVISSESQYFYSRTALMYIYMGHMRFVDTKPYEDWFWDKNRINLIQDLVENVDFDNKELALSSGTKMSYDKLVIGVGSKSNKFGWPGQDLDGVRGLYSLQDLEVMEEFSPNLNRAVIVGGGLIGIEMAEMFRSRDISVTMIVREKEYWDNVLPVEEAAMISNHVREHHIDLRLDSNLKEILNDGSDKVSGIVIEETGETIECGFVGLTPGVSPNIDFLREGKIDTNRGILVDEYLETNIPDVYAVGDCAELRTPPEGRKPIEAVWYVGRMMGETCAHNICGYKVEYAPGIWFNSAKFLDIEYQVYGTVLNNPPANHRSFFWQEESQRKSVRVVFDAESEKVLGFNLLGVRFRHEVCEKWIRDGTQIDEVIQNIRLAIFDPEFSKNYEMDLLRAYNQFNKSSAALMASSGLDPVTEFLQN